LIPAFAAWATGRPFIFPSLGPSAFALALGEDAISARRIIGGHSIGIAAGFLSYHLLAWGLAFTTFPVLVSRGFAAGGERHHFVVADKRRNACNTHTTFSRLRNHPYSIPGLVAITGRLRNHIHRSLNLVRHSSNILYASDIKN
jgi:hypothetical protein